VFLVGAQVRLRLVFAEDGARPVPAGKYRVKHYDVQQGDFFLSASGQKGPMVEVKAGEEVELPMDGTFKFAANVRPRKGAYGVGTCPGDGHGMAIVLIKAGRLVEMSAVVRDAEGKELSRTPMRYG
jgi:hypothetical protein